MAGDHPDFGQSASAAAGEAIGTAVGQAVVVIASEFGRRIVTYWAAKDAFDSSETQPVVAQLPPYAIVGIGRCGSHVSAELAGMLLASQPRSAGADSKLRLPWLTSWFGKGADEKHAPPKPMMIIGDIDETTFPDVSQYFKSGSTLQNQLSYEQLDYRPLAHGGAGHVPAFGEFITRGLLLLAPFDQDQRGRPWADARRYLLEVCSSGRNAPRLVFYVFSSGGGTGSGAAAELVRAQRVAMALSNSPEPEIYLTGMTILPRGLMDGMNRRHLINTGRLFVQHLSEINLQLTTAAAYSAAQAVSYQFSVLDTFKNKRPIRPLDSLGVVSNESMFLASAASQEGDAKPTYERAESLANRYIAQQVFALAASQIRQQQDQPRPNSAEPGHSDDAADNARIQADGVDFQSTRLDPHDLKTSLRGPYAIAFGVGEPSELAQPGGIDRLFLRAVSLPSMQTGREARMTRDVITGLSVLPSADTSAYAELIRPIDERAAKGQLLTQAELVPLSDIPLFAKCPRVVFVVNAPDDADLDAKLPHRVCQLVSWLMPRLNEARYAVVRQATGYFGLSIFIQASVILCPEIQKAIRNFVKLSWKCRNETGRVFNERFDKLLQSEPPLSDEDVKDWIGEREQYHLNVDEYDASMRELQARWRAFVEAHEKDPQRKRELLEHSLDGCMLSHRDVSAALRYMNYVHNLTAAELA